MGAEEDEEEERRRRLLLCSRAIYVHVKRKKTFAKMKYKYVLKA